MSQAGGHLMLSSSEAGFRIEKIVSGGGQQYQAEKWKVTDFKTQKYYTVKTKSRKKI